MLFSHIYFVYAQQHFQNYLPYLLYLTILPLSVYYYLKMPKNRPGLNSRQHRFCLNILAGMPPQEAYINAGYSSHPGNLTGAPYQIVSDNPSVKAFLDEKRRLKEQIVLANSVNDTTTLSQTEKRQLLANFARAQLTDLIDEDDVPKLNRDSLAAKALKEYEVIPTQHGTRKRIKLADPIAAIQEDNKMMGHYAPSKHLVAKKVQLEITHVKKVRGGEIEDA